ncbi:MAG: cytochrome bc complex cytochrome b subunit [Anaerolineaceae bacterium]|nr:MAG: cytochrome bc complex cytochrome b subunit [Anaerolineaceae bacterium]
MTERARHPILRLRSGRAISLLLIFVSGFFLLAIPAAASPVLDSITPTATAYTPPTPTMYLVTLTPTPTLAPTPTFDVSRLDKPIVDEPPSQLDEGLLVYWGVCMACHGDTGQGLTDAWRDSFGEDRDCWTSKCHASNHPPQGFEFPRLVPSLSDKGTLLRFVNAEQLYQYNLANMPWWDPGSLTKEKALAVTAYLLKMNGKLPEGVTLTAANGQFIPIQYTVMEPPAQSNLWKYLLAGALILSGIGIGLQSVQPHAGKRPSFILHLHPPTIPALQARFRYTLGAGGLAVFLCIILLVTGLLEMFYYIPSTERAAATIQEITFLVPYGGLVRNLHFWSAQALVVVAAIHLLRVVFTGAYAKPRRFNYILGLGLFVIVLLLDFTGYVLRWDEGIRWALIAGTNLLGSVPKIGEGLVRFVSGNLEPGPAMLIRFYAWHLFGLAILGGILMIWHLFRVRRDGGIAATRVERIGNPPDEESAPTRISRAELLRREAITMLVAGGILLLISTFLPAPIEQPMSSTLVSLAESRAPWFFLWVQELLKVGDPFLWGVATPLIVVLLLGLIPYVFPRVDESEIGRWLPRSGRAAQLFLATLLVTIITLTILATR